MVYQLYIISNALLNIDNIIYKYKVYLYLLKGRILGEGPSEIYLLLNVHNRVFV